MCYCPPSPPRPPCAVQILDGAPLRDVGRRMTVSVAKFEMKGEAYMPKQRQSKREKKVGGGEGGGGGHACFSRALAGGSCMKGSCFALAREGGRRGRRGGHPG